MSEINNWLKYFSILNNNNTITTLNLDSDFFKIYDSNWRKIQRYELNDNNAWIANKIFYKSIKTTILYKYASISENTVKMIRNNKVWFSKAEDFNDPFEIIKPLPLNDNEIISNFERTIKSNNILRQDYESFKKINPDLMKFVIDQWVNKTKMNNSAMIPKCQEDFKIYCMSEICNNILMWSHYSNHHKGLCFEFDILEDVELFYGISKVVYKNSYPNLKLITTEFYINNLLECMITKFHDWNYEKEYRVLKNMPNENLHSFNKNSLKSVIFGWKTECKDIIMIRNLICNTKGYEHVVFKGAVKNERAFKLDIVGFDDYAKIKNLIF